MVFIVVLALQSAPAQYDGGNEDGYTNGITVGTKLNGEISSFAVLFQGANGDGFHQTLASNFTLGGEQPMLFNGGLADGWASDKVSQTLGGFVIAIIYEGGTGDGFSRISSEPLILSGQDLALLYQGSEGDGYAQELLVDVLLGGFLAMLFEGGDGDGYAVTLLPDTLLQGVMTELYEGGDGDGFSTAELSETLLGGFIAAIFEGGMGDGYASEEVTTALTLDVIDALIAFDVLLYPNPASDVVHLKLPTGVVVDYVQLFDTSGKEVQVTLNPDNSVDISRLPSGLYLVNIISEDKRSTKKLIIK